jgi:hypothetical protein
MSHTTLPPRSAKNKAELEQELFKTMMLFAAFKATLFVVLRLWRRRMIRKYGP